jgi:siroheme synthase-like protein
MSYYPIFLQMSGKPVLVVGAGKVGLRKIKGLLEAGARVTVVAPRGEPELKKLGVTWLQRKFRTSDVGDQVLVFTATDDRKVNHRVAQLAKRRSIPVNVADAPAECDFLVPSRIHSDDVQIAISTGGRSPRLAAVLRRKLEAALAQKADSGV